ncbi:MAG TPA: PilZ domain-containing protein, partial [Gammaproteobacteria bacterium]|nr:PilZ domain-containing protein [Gammaproteobacteria bacterium]
CKKVVGPEYDGLLKLLQQIKKPVQLMVDDETSATHHYHTSVVMQFDPQQKQILLEPSDENKFNELIVEHGLILLTQLDEGMIQIAVEQVELRDEGVHCQLPDSYLLVQHRQSHRTKTHGDLKFDSLSLREMGVREIIVEDLSDLGLGLKLTGKSLYMPPKGTQLYDGQLTLPLFGNITIDVKIMGGKRYQGSDGREGMVVGVTFVRLSSGTRALLQRYIFRRDLEDRGRLDELENLDHSQIVAGNPVMLDRM